MDPKDSPWSQNQKARDAESRRNNGIALGAIIGSILVIGYLMSTTRTSSTSSQVVAQPVPDRYEKLLKLGADLQYYAGARKVFEACLKEKAEALAPISTATLNACQPGKLNLSRVQRYELAYESSTFLDYTPIQRKIFERCLKVQADTLASALNKIVGGCENAVNNPTRTQKAALQAEQDGFEAANQARQDAFEAEKQVRENAELRAKPIPSMVAVSVQSTANNLGINVFLTVTDANDQEIAVTGEVEILLTAKKYPNEWIVLRGTKDILSSEFTSGTRGQGTFKRDATFIEVLKNYDTQKYSGAYGEAQVTFKTKFHGDFKAKDFVSYP
jgi:hypothetical protein